MLHFPYTDYTLIHFYLIIFLLILQFIYKGKVSVPSGRIDDLIEAASSLKIKGTFP